MDFSAVSDINGRRRTIILLQDLARVISTAAGMIPMIISLMGKGEIENLEKEYGRIKELDMKAEDIKRNVINTLTKIGPILSSRDELIRLVSSLGSIMDLLEATAFRITYYNKIRDIPKDILEKLLVLSKEITEIISSLRECVFLMGYNPSRISDVGRKMVEKELQIDRIRRNLELRILNDESGALPMIALLEIIRRLEAASDEALNALDLVTILVVI